jgi:hypothetical protein
MDDKLEEDFDERGGGLFEELSYNLCGETKKSTKNLSQA